MADLKEKKALSIWINYERRVISFSPCCGFEELRFQTREEKLRFAVEKGEEGFAIQ